MAPRSTDTVPQDAPEHCPGTESDQAGKADACAGCPNQNVCATTPKGPDPDIPHITKRMSTVKHKLLVLSGKGGVGKSSFTAQLAYALAHDDTQVGVMDVDICGPSIPTIMGLEGEQIHQTGSGWQPVFVQDNLAVMSIGFMLPDKDDAVIWRGPKKNGLIKQFLRDVDWQDLDYLLVDTPPGTSDEHLSVAQYLKESGIDGAIIITTPQEVALQDVRKEIDFCRKVKIPIVGVVENMSGFVCPNCKGESTIFPPTTGGAEKMAKEMNVKFLGRIPLDPRIAKSCDMGVSFLDEYPESPACDAYDHVIDHKLNILLVGAGGREHAIAWKLAQSPLVEKIFVAPGNGGTTTEGKLTSVDIGVSDFAKLTEFAINNNVNFVVAGPEQPLVDGIQPAFKKIGIPVFGPSLKAAAMEGSKTFSKDFMKKHNIPTAAFENFTDFEKAKKYVETVGHRVVLKASGLAAGKGVLIPETTEEAVEGLKSIMVNKEFGSAGDEIVVEEYLEGEELSFLAFADGYTVVSLPPAQDHKRALDGDLGPNTGGMGCYAPTPIGTQDLIDEVKRTILQPTIDGMRRDGYPFVGMLFTGIMLTSTGPKVLEYNVRFGDPETEVVLPLLSDDTDLAEVMFACAEGRLDAVHIGIKNAYAATVVIASGGYPGSYEKGKEITIGNVPQDVMVFHAGTAMKNNKLVTAGGRVLAVSAVASTLREAVDKAYEGVNIIKFDDMYYRKDIAHRAFKHTEQKDTGISYASAGVSIDAGNLLVQKIKSLVKSTKRVGADSEIGGFGGIFDLKAAGYRDPILVSATDGIGTKLKIAHDCNIHNTVGIDLVAMNVNDLIVQGAEPLFFLDYFACGKLEVDVAKDFVAGVVEGCLQSGAALVGGETAEMPGLYAPGDYDAAGFTTGAVDRENILPRMDQIKSGDVLLGLSSSGVHSNGFSLVRKIVGTQPGLTYHSPCPWDKSTTLGKALLTPTRIYVKQLLPVVRQDLVKAMAHITGGGFIDNIPRVLPEHLGVQIDATSWPLPPVFKWLKAAGNVSAYELSRTFNCGIGMVLVADRSAVPEITRLLAEANEQVFEIGQLVEKSALNGEEVVVNNTEQAW